MEGGQVLQAFPQDTPYVFTEDITRNVEGLEVRGEGRGRNGRQKGSQSRSVLSPKVPVLQY